jgi:predicted DNA-binding transcriptional regulator YafY
METFERRWRLLEILLEGPQMRETIVERLHELAGSEDGAATGLSPSNVTSDVQALRKLGIGFRPLRAVDKKAKQKYELDLPLLSVFANRAEAHALFVASRLLRQLNLPEAAQLERLLARVPASVRKPGFPEQEDLLRPATEPGDLDTVLTLQQALRTGKPITISYRSMGGQARRYEVEAGHLSWIDGALYLVAHCPDEAGETIYHRNREFRVDRFVPVGTHPTVEVHRNRLASRTEVPTFKLKLLAAPTFAPRFVAMGDRVKLGPFEPDGSRLVSFTESIPLRAVRRVLSYGDLVRVVAPDFIQTELRGTLDRMLARLAEEP